MNTSRWDNSGFLQLSEVSEFSYFAKILLHRNTILPALETCLRLDTDLKSERNSLILSQISERTGYQAIMSIVMRIRCSM